MTARPENQKRKDRRQGRPGFGTLHPASSPCEPHFLHWTRVDSVTADVTCVKCPSCSEAVPALALKVTLLRGCEEKEPFYTVGGGIHGATAMRMAWRFLRKLNAELPHWRIDLWLPGGEGGSGRGRELGVWEQVRLAWNLSFQQKQRRCRSSR